MRYSFGRILALASLACLPAGRAEVSCAPLFSNNAVLQRDKPIAIWGRGAAGEKVLVAFLGESAGTTTSSDGRWIVFLDPLPASTQGADLTVSGKNTVVLHDVVVGEVWLCSGQSNMEFHVSQAQNAAQEIAAANNALIRHVTVARRVADTPVDAVETSGWQPATPAAVGNFTAVGYFFAREIFQKLGVPIGIVHSSWGGTPIESWMSPAAIASDPKFGTIYDRWKQALADYPTAKPAYDARHAQWAAEEATAKAQGAAAHAAFLKQHPWERAPRGPGDSWTPSGLYNGMINPLVPYALRGVLWYQGESNAERASEYHDEFAAMITAWRGHFGQGDIPFYWVNLANYKVPGDRTDRTWAFLREAQTQTLSLPNTGQALAIDIGDPNNIHPTNKQEVGRRLSRLAENRVYGITSDDTGPTFVSAGREGSALRVRFTNASGGLIAHDKPPAALEIAGADRVFHPAAGRIERDTLVVSAPEVREPVAVRYAWTNAPDANLYNGAGLPAVPFRSDDW
jgi:sialate O-acetylesterase